MILDNNTAMNYNTNPAIKINDFLFGMALDVYILKVFKKLLFGKPAEEIFYLDKFHNSQRIFIPV